MTLTILVATLVLGAFANTGTLLHTFAVAFDALTEEIGWNSTAPLTISSRAGLAEKAGHPLWAKIIGTIFFRPTHCKEALKGDQLRCIDGLRILMADRPDVITMLDYIEKLDP
jgi:hypothetical protein